MLTKLKANWKIQLAILWFGQVILMAMLAMSLPYWPLYIATLGDFSANQIRFWSAAIYIAPFASTIVSSPLWGKLGDQYGYKLMVIRACLGLFITQTLILFTTQVELLFLIRFLQGILAGFIVAAQTWALSISPANEKGATIGKLQSATAIGNLLGPLMGGIIATYAGYHAIFSSSSFICAFITILFFYLLQDTSKSSTETPKNTAKTTTWLTCLSKQVLPILLIISIMQIARSMITPVFALFVTEHLHGNDITVGVLYAASGLMIFVTAAWWGRFFDKMIQAGQPVYPIITFLLFLSAGLQILHAHTDSATLIFILRLFWGICLGALFPVLLRLLISDNTESNSNGFYLGLANSATKFGNLLGMVLGAVIEARLGYTNSFYTTALFYIFAGILILLYAKPADIKDEAVSHE